MYSVTKRYGHDRGYSVAFRQFKAESHCRFLHGYSLAFEFTFVGEILDKSNWLIDFGGFKKIKAFLDENFDHKTLVDINDTELNQFKELHAKGIIDINILPNLSCESIAEFIFSKVVDDLNLKKEVSFRLESVKVSEHEGNSATYSEVYDIPLPARL
jgi:6-pyruvoyltetrahydropterin/6-carboxytetrahydropterin synthase